MWTKEWPTKQGWYWYYGKTRMSETLYLSAVKVRHDGKGNPIYIDGAQFISKKDGFEREGWWKRMEDPDLPESIDMFICPDCGFEQSENKLCGRCSGVNVKRVERLEL